SLPNFMQWSNNVVHNIRETFPNFTYWAHDVVHKVNTNVTQTFPQWADNVVHNVRESFPNFTQQTNDVVHRVNTNVTLSIPKFTEIDSQILQTARTSAQDLVSITSTLVTVTNTLTTVTNTLASLQDTSTSTAGVVDDILATRKALTVILANFLPTSCKQIFTQFPTSPSGYYALASDNGSDKYSAYCNMEELCGSGGWTRLAYLNMSNATVNCPSGFRRYHSGGVRACGRPVTSYGNCASVQFPSNGIRYSQICGRVVGYQFGNSDALDTANGNHNNINGPYVDGVSITRGSSRHHVWTLIASWQSSYCPCSNGGGFPVQYFVGSHYFCESGSGFSDPLWDGQGCGYYDRACCNAAGLPWFHRDYGNTTSTDYIELRVCGDEGTSNEDAPVGYYEIYV
uniref:Fibrinogen C-terminal domain-containing protein n=1 Tax=Amphimedon queenslandica TaxID=400682 RepID=A0A1X7SUF2_AMPQE